MLRVKKDLTLALCKEMAPQNKQDRYKLRSNANFNLPPMKSVHNCLEILSYLSQKIWGILPLEINQTESLLEFKGKIKNWNPQCCP